MCEGPNLSSSNFLKAIQIQLTNETRNPSMTKMSGKNFLFKNFLISNFDHRPILAPTDCIGIGRVLNKQDLTSRIFFTFLMNGVSISFNFLKWILFYNSIRILDKNLKYYSTATFSLFFILIVIVQHSPPSKVENRQWCLGNFPISNFYIEIQKNNNKSTSTPPIKNIYFHNSQPVFLNFYSYSKIKPTPNKIISAVWC